MLIEPLRQQLQEAAEDFYNCGGTEKQFAQFFVGQSLDQVGWKDHHMGYDSACRLVKAIKALRDAEAEALAELRSNV